LMGLKVMSKGRQLSLMKISDDLPNLGRQIGSVKGYLAEILRPVGLPSLPVQHRDKILN
jgi:hypothetical protein